MPRLHRIVDYIAALDLPFLESPAQSAPEVSTTPHIANMRRSTAHPSPQSAFSTRATHARPPGEAARVAESLLAAFLVRLGVPCAPPLVARCATACEPAWREGKPLRVVGLLTEHK